MRYSRFYIPTRKEAPRDAELISHQLMIRAGMIRQLARGIYDYLPLGLRAIQKVEKIVREEMNRAESNEVLLPVVQPSELWLKTDRWEAWKNEGLLATLADRHKREYCLGPTHEEVMTHLVHMDVRSYKELPVSLYQIQTKFRDEIRPRFGLMRAREFIMKDAYTFDMDEAGAHASYQGMYDAYTRVFERCGLTFRPVEALTGNMGGSKSHEFQVLADSGEDAIAACKKCDYAANVEKAARRVFSDAKAAAPSDAAVERVDTPGQHTIEEVTAFLKKDATELCKTLVYESNDGVVVALVRGDHHVNEEKLKAVVGDVEWLRPAKEDVVTRVTGAPVGFAGPVRLKEKTKIIADHDVAAMSGFVTGANENDAHLLNVSHGRDFDVDEWAEIRAVATGDPCARCDGGTLEVVRGIEVGHVFYLGTKYSKALEATVQDEDGNDVVIEMGSYGIGITRTVAAAIEQNHDKDGIIWPTPIAPFTATVISLNPDDETVNGTAEKIYEALEAAGIDTLFDDRSARAGAKFKDADLIGIPHRIVVGARGLKEGTVELKDRRTGNVDKIAPDEAANAVAQRVATELSA